MFGVTEDHQTTAQNTNAVLIVGKKETKINASFSFLIDNFSYFENKSFFKTDGKPMVFKFLKTSESTMLRVLEFVQKGKLFLIFLNNSLKVRCNSNTVLMVFGLF